MRKTGQLRGWSNFKLTQDLAESVDTDEFDEFQEEREDTDEVEEELANPLLPEEALPEEELPAQAEDGAPSEEDMPDVDEETSE